MTRRTRGILAAGLAAALTLGIAGPAAAESDGFWYFDQLGIGEVHASGLTGEGITIAVMDSPINTDIPTLRDANVTVIEPSLCFDEAAQDFYPAVSTDRGGVLDAIHGTNVVSMISGTGDGYPGQAGIKGVAPDAEVLYYVVNVTDVTSDGDSIACVDPDLGFSVSDDRLGVAMEAAMDAGADIISVSSLVSPGGQVLDRAIARAVREEVVIVAGTLNTTDIVFGAVMPAGGNGVLAVQAGGSTGDQIPVHNIYTKIIAPGLDVTVQGAYGESWEEQELTSGSSMATPLAAGILALAMQKYPEASPNQLLQSLIRNTSGDGNPDAVRSPRFYGYGYISLRKLLAADPTQYSTANPFVVMGDELSPTFDEIYNPVEPTAAPVAPEEKDPLDAIVPLLIGIAIVGILLLIGAVVLVIVLVRRSKRHNQPTDPLGDENGRV
ncbi:S8 family peptidase [Salinibacterium sp. PAMC 21357]|uniref:S8 family peptidase n=1 Tax=Salinibacterium sp. PAMC 21357 TaxID=1112215 RepID=UPI0002880981|nr:S8 family serine peptidase [Salinibacterium sp. PAMC 21357]